MYDFFNVNEETEIGFYLYRAINIFNELIDTIVYLTNYTTLFVLSIYPFCLLQYKVFEASILKYNFNIKQMSHILSLLNSCCMVTVSCITNYSLYNYDLNMIKYKLSENIYLDVISVLSTGFFTSFLIVDIIIGYLYYHDFMKTLSGYPHHIFFIFGMIFVVVFNEYRLFSLFLITELPTMIYAFGNINSKYRSKYMFGITMFFFRIVYHIVLTLLNITSYHVIIITFPSLFMNIYWFNKLLKSQC